MFIAVTVNRFGMRRYQRWKIKLWLHLVVMFSELDHVTLS